MRKSISLLSMAFLASCSIFQFPIKYQKHNPPADAEVGIIEPRGKFEYISITDRSCGKNENHGYYYETYRVLTGEVASYVRGKFTGSGYSCESRIKFHVEKNKKYILRYLEEPRGVPNCKAKLSVVTLDGNTALVNFEYVSLWDQIKNKSLPQGC